MDVLMILLSKLNRVITPLIYSLPSTGRGSDKYMISLVRQLLHIKNPSADELNKLTLGVDLMANSLARALKRVCDEENTRRRLERTRQEMQHTPSNTFTQRHEAETE